MTNFFIQNCIKCYILCCQLLKYHQFENIFYFWGDFNEMFIYKIVRPILFVAIWKLSYASSARNPIIFELKINISGMNIPVNIK